MGVEVQLLEDCTHRHPKCGRVKERELWDVDDKNEQLQPIGRCSIHLLPHRPHPGHGPTGWPSAWRTGGHSTAPVSNTFGWARRGPRLHRPSPAVEQCSGRAALHLNFVPMGHAHTPLYYTFGYQQRQRGVVISLAAHRREPHGIVPAKSFQEMEPPVDGMPFQLVHQVNLW